MTQKRQPRGFICSGIKEMKNSDYHRKKYDDKRDDAGDYFSCALITLLSFYFRL